MRDSVAVTGANGYVGRNLRRALASAGTRAVCIARRDFAARAGERKVVSSLEPSARLDSALRRCRAMVHLAGVGRHVGGAKYTDNVELAQMAVAACRRARVRRIVYVGGLGSEGGATGYFASKAAAERVIASSGLDYVVFRASYITGRGDALTRKVRRHARARAAGIPGSGAYLIQPIHVDDACELLARAASEPRYSRIVLDMVGPERVRFADFARRAAGARVRRVPMEQALRRASRSAMAPYDIDELAILAGGFTGDHARLRRVSQMRFRSALP